MNKLFLGIRDLLFELGLLTTNKYSKNVDYIKIIENTAFRKAKFLSKLKDTTMKKEDIDKLLQKVEDDANYFEPQKVIIESIIYIDDFDIMIACSVA